MALHMNTKCRVKVKNCTPQIIGERIDLARLGVGSVIRHLMS